MANLPSTHRMALLHFQFTPGRAGSTPNLTLSYNSGGGNGIFGLGWACDVPAIQRKTDRKLPEYLDDVDSDVFTFSGAEDLVPEIDNNGNRVVTTNAVTNVVISNYRPRIEGGFSRIQKIEDQGNVYWEVRSKENIVSVFGKTDDSKLVSPYAGEGHRVFKWCLEYSYDDRGNIVLYEYKMEDEAKVLTGLSEQNRLNGIAPFTNVYLKRVKYSNKVAYYENDPLPSEFYFEMVFDFGEHDELNPTSKSSIINGVEKEWNVRIDPFSDYKAGFEIRTYRLCRRILMFHHFNEEAEGLPVEDYLVRTLKLDYEEAEHITYLLSVTQTGFIWNDDGSLQATKALPPYEFQYLKPEFSREVKEVSLSSLAGSPIGLDNQLYQWIDLNSEGISGILTEQANGWYYKENNGNGELGAPRLINPKPSFLGLGNGTLSIQELTASGKKYLVKSDGSLKGYVGLNVEEQWESFKSFEKFPNIDMQDPNLKFIDLNGDGMPDLLVSREQDFIWYAAQGTSGYDDYHLAAKAMDEEKGPRILFANQDERLIIATADMSGDGLSDIVLISYASVFYYPNLGFGKFGARVCMPMADCFDTQMDFNPKQIHFADIDGTGTADIIYTGKNKIQIWFNECGNSLRKVDEFFNPFPRIDSQTKISFIDLLGNGTSCMVWCSALPQNREAPIKYVDLMQGRKPHVMSGHKNNLGKEVSLEYKPSTYFYLQDKKQGKQWITKLPFPVQCVSKVITEDKVSRTRFVNEYSYHHGYYDISEREFRGFALVVQRDVEKFEHYVKGVQLAGASNSIEKDLFQPTVITKSWFHTGVYLNRNKQLHLLAAEYYPDSLLASGAIQDPHVIAALENSRSGEFQVTPELSADELPECYRALKGLPLRQEIFSEEGSSELQLHPYSVTQFNYEVQLLQPKAGMPHGVFLAHEKEKLVFQFERNPLDPRIAHSINIEIDAFGNVLEAASIVYGRKLTDINLPTAADNAKQSKQWITYSKSRFTNFLSTTEVYRLPLLCDSETWELNTGKAASNFFTASEIKQRMSSATTKSYEQDALINEKRKIEHSRTYFFKDDLTGPLSLGQTGIRALPYENYLLAFTPSLLTYLYNGKVDETLLRNEARLIQLDGDVNYWIKSGITFYHPDLSAHPFAKSIGVSGASDVSFAKRNFFLPVVYQDNFGHLTKLFYDPCKLIPVRSIDAKDNETSVLKINYRTVSPYLTKDTNDNRAGIRFDALGLVTHTFVMGKENEFKGDPMDINSLEFSVNDQPTSTLEYNFDYFTTNGRLPCRVKTSVRERHHYKEPDIISFAAVADWLVAITKLEPAQLEGNVIWQESYSYSDGSGHEVLKKIRAEPGDAPERDADGVLAKDASGQLKQVTTNARWIGNGRTIFNNKGNPVKQYEPFFDSTHEYNNEIELTALGFTSLIYYDALSRVTRTEYPNGTFSKVVFDAWTQKSYDQNDTVLESKWYSDRISGTKGLAEQEAARGAAVHANTPSISYLDSLGRKFLEVAHNKTQRSNEALFEEHYQTRTQLDIESNALSVTDARGNTVMSWKYDMLGNVCFQHSMDAGDRWMLQDVMGRPIRLWDSRQQQFRYTFDELHRPLTMMVNRGQGEIAYEKMEYGESFLDAKLKNLRAKPYLHKDTAGIVTFQAYDFKGNPLASTRQVISDYKKTPDWNANPGLENEVFTQASCVDAVNRPVQLRSPDGSITMPRYNEAGLLEGVDVKVRGAAATSFVQNIDYNAKGQRERILYGNNTVTNYKYEPETYRLIRLLTTANQGSSILQDLNYTFDPVGNITQQHDNAQKTVFYGGQKVDAVSEYAYDAIYRLVEANGREHIGQAAFAGTDNWSDDWCRLALQPNSPIQLREYTQKYTYDAVGNINKMQHVATGGSWTRDYFYNTGNNQLTRTRVGGDDFNYAYNAHGSITRMPHLAVMEWNFREEMNHVDLGAGRDAWYVYDSSGQRLRKIIEQQGNRMEDRYYLGSVEVYRTRAGLERETLHIMDDQQRIAMVETRTRGSEPSSQQLTRYQYSNHLGTACLELNEQGRVISYEEHHPYGTSALQATDATIQVLGKRYRYTGMERDEETGLEYHSARYYLPWLGRWCSCDPSWLVDGPNLFRYVSGNPISHVDYKGFATSPPPEVNYAPLLSNAGAEAAQFYADLVVEGEKQGGVAGAVKVAGGWVGGFFASLWTPETATQTGVILVTAGVGSLAGAGALGKASFPIARTMAVIGSYEVGVSTTQAVTGTTSGAHVSDLVNATYTGQLDVGRELSSLERGMEATNAVVGWASMGVTYANQLKQPQLYKTPAEYANQRSSELQDALPKVNPKTGKSGSYGRITMSTSVNEGIYGHRSVSVTASGGGANVRASVRAILNPTERVVTGPNAHAEVKNLLSSPQYLERPVAVGAGRPICTGCETEILSRGATPASPTRSGNVYGEPNQNLVTIFRW
jgi:RHS repeat-associated protein